MVKEKYMPWITIVAIVLAVSIAAGAIFMSIGKQSSLVQPDYVNQLFNKNKVMQIDISVDETQWNTLLENATAEEYIPCDISINGTTLKTIGIRAKGNSSLSQVASDSTTDRYSFKLNFSEYIGGQNLYGLDAMALNNMISDASYMKEYLSYEMMAEMGVKTPAYSYANISLNGEEWGLYLAVEVLEEDFLTRYYGSNYGNLYKPESSQMGGGKQGDKDNEPGEFEMPQGEMPQGEMPQGGMPQGEMPQGGAPNNVQGGFNTGENANPPSIANNQQADLGKENFADMPQGDRQQGGMPNMGGGSSGTNLVYTDDNISSYSGIFDDPVTKSTKESDMKKVISMMKNLSNGTNLESCLDVDEILRYFAVNTFLVNLDSYAGSMKHNYYLYEEDGIFEILPWDFNLSFGSFQMSDSSKVINFPIDTPVTDTMENSPLISKLLEVEEYKETYHKYLEEIVSNYITSGKYDSDITRLDSRHSLLYI